MLFSCSFPTHSPFLVLGLEPCTDGSNDEEAEGSSGCSIDRCVYSVTFKVCNYVLAKPSGRCSCVSNSFLNS